MTGTHRISLVIVSIVSVKQDIMRSSAESKIEEGVGGLR